MANSLFVVDSTIFLKDMQLSDCRIVGSVSLVSYDYNLIYISIRLIYHYVEGTLISVELSSPPPFYSE